MAAQYDLNELGKLSGMPPRTIRYYIQEHLLPRPHGKGPKASYGDEHLDRLLLIRNLQERGETLEKIRDLLGVMDEAAVRVSLSDLASDEQQPMASPADSSSALEYIRMAQTADPTAARLQQFSSLHDASLRSSSPAASSGTHRYSTWQHIALTPDIELHVRRPLPRPQHRELERLLEAAKDIFGREIS